jgi:hypothetical protein
VQVVDGGELKQTFAGTGNPLENFHIDLEVMARLRLLITVPPSSARPAEAELQSPREETPKLGPKREAESRDRYQFNCAIDDSPFVRSQVPGLEIPMI